MSFVAATIELEQFFTAAFSLTTVEYPNAAIDTSNLTDWIRFGIQSTKSQQMSLGGTQFRYSGIIIIQIFVRPDIGLKRVNEVIDNISNIFRAKVVGTYVFQVPEPVIVGESDGWYQTNLIIPFWRQE